VSVNEITATFINEVQGQLKEEREGNWVNANKHADEINKLANKLKKMGSTGESELINLANHQDPYVRLWAACNLDESAKEYAIKVLEELALHPNEDYGHKAQIHLDYNM